MAPKSALDNQAVSRSGWMNAMRSAAIAETIKKEERTLYRMLQKQIELGRIIMPPEEDSADDAEAGAADSQDGCSKAIQASAVDEQAAWLLAAHRGAGQPLPWDEIESVSQQRQDEAQGPCSPEARAAERERTTAEVREQMRGISRSLWSTVSVAASGQGSYTSRAAADYRAATVAEMQQQGDLSSEHHRRRDAFSTYMEAAVRDMVLRRSVGPKPPGGS